MDSPAHTLTFVTSFMNIYGRVHNNKPSEMRYQHFQQVAASGIPIVLFIDSAGKEQLQLPAMSNVHIFDMEFEELELVQETRRLGDLQLPAQRCMKKDTLEFMMLMHAKIECMVKAMEKNPFHTDHFAWMDFSLSYIFKQPEVSIARLKTMSKRPLKKSLFVIPGCWSKGYLLDQMWNCILWRFCGGFFVADRESLLYFYELYLETYPSLLQDSKRMTWETNVWCYLEEKKGWSPSWFAADHNDSMICIPEEYFI